MQVKIAVLDDYQGVALRMADWSEVAKRAQLDVFSDHLADSGEVRKRLLPYDIVCVMRERTPLRRALIEQLPNLKLIASTAIRNASIDSAAAAERGIAVVGLEPSCLLTLRDEYLAMGLGDDAVRLSQRAMLFEEFISAQADAGQLRATC